MTRRIESHEIAGPAGRLEALLEEPHEREPWCAAVVCHPHPQYGGTLHNKVVYRLARGLRRAGIAVLRFNYRAVGRSQGEYGNLDGEIEDARAALEWLRARYPGLPHALAGFSFGARVITRLGCETRGARFLLAAGFPTAMGAAEYLERCAVEKSSCKARTTNTGRAWKWKPLSRDGPCRSVSYGLKPLTTFSRAGWRRWKSGWRQWRRRCNCGMLNGSYGYHYRQRWLD